MINAPVIAGLLTYLLMLLAYSRPHRRYLHAPLMIGVMLFDLAMPFYLYTHRDWKTRLIDHEDILSFLVWMHIGLLVSLFFLYAMQIPAGRKLWRGDEQARPTHAAQAKGILIMRGLVLITGALLVEQTTT
ncbi:MAG: hypothetical protein AABY83_09230 [Pseudomonadota bacterium]